MANSALFFVLAVSCILANAVAPQQPRLQFENVTFQSVVDGKVITTTDNLESPGPYNVYGTSAQTDEKLPKQRWAVSTWSDSKISVSPNDGPYLNTFSTYKPCPDCFAASENWVLEKEDGDIVDFSENSIQNVTGRLISTWTYLCLNPGNDYLVKGVCDGKDNRQLWNIIFTQ